jgi:DNA-binding LytR/AlgR family response regulator
MSKKPPNNRIPLVKLGENRFDPKDIVTCLADQGSTKIVTIHGTFTYGRNLGHVKAKLEQWGFEEVGRHGIINRAHLLRVETKKGHMQAVLTGDIKVPVSDSARHRFS